MSSPIEPIIMDDFSGGVIRCVSPYKQPTNSVKNSVNFIFDEKVGEATLRKGTSMVGSQIVDNKPVLGLANFRDNGANHALLAVVSDGTNNDVYAGTTWTKSLQDDTKDLKTRFCQFLDSIVRVNGTDGAKSFNGTAWVTTAGVFDLANFPASVKYVANYKDRVHAIGDDGILYSSSVPRYFLSYDGQSANFNVGAVLTGGTSGAKAIILRDSDSGTTGTLELTSVIGTFVNDETITDNGSTPGSAAVNGTGAYQLSWRNGYITTPIDPDNGSKGKATGLGVIGGLLLIFFERAIYTWNGKATEADRIVDIGCSSQESVVNCQSFLFFANNDGLYVTQGGYPQKISRFVQDYFDGMSSANYQNIACGSDGKHIFCSLGDVTINGKTITSAVLRYTVQSQEWAVLSYPTQPRVFSSYISTNDVQLLYGDNDGNVIQIDSTAVNDSYAATSANIDYEIDFYDIFRPLRGAKKVIKDRVIVNSENSSGACLYYKTDKRENREESFKMLGEIDTTSKEIKISSIPFKVLNLRIAGISSKGRLALQSLEITNIDFYGY